MPFFLRFPGAVLFLAGAFFLSWGCASSPPASAALTQTRIIPGVAFLPQQDETCGPTSLSMLLRFHGKDASAQELQEETRTSGLRGSLITDLAQAARRRGVGAEVVSLELPGLLSRVVAGEPVILLVDQGMLLWSRPHYMIVYGATPEGVIAHSGQTEGAVISYGALEKQWSKMGSLAIVAPVSEQPE